VVKARLALSTSLALLILASCAPGRLSRDQAADSLRKQPEFGDFNVVVLFLHPQVFRQDGPDGPAYRAAAQAGFITIIPRVGNIATAVITPQGEKAAGAPGWKLGPGASRADELVIPVATRELTEVTGVVGSGREAQVDFTWRFRLTDTGKELVSHGLSFATPAHGAKASFRRHDDGWRVESITLISRS
jgi:hypothetical protein